MRPIRLFTVAAAFLLPNGVTTAAAAMASSPAGAPPAAPAATPHETMPPNPFAGFDSYRLGNGLKVWHRHIPGATIASMAVAVPCGRDHDPPGREQTAHLLEHVLLSDRAGRTEVELIRELTARGGSYAGITGPHYTLFPISVESAHSAFGVQWLHDVIAPRIFHDDLVSRNRAPVAVELEGTRRPLLRGAAARLLDPRTLHPAGFWEREFGYAAFEERRADEVASLSRITAADVRRFYDTCYSPAAMTLVIVGGGPRAELQPIIEATFGTLPWRPEPQLLPSQPREGASARHLHTTTRSTRYTLTWRIDGLDGRDHLRLIFLEDLLRHRLDERLRSGTVKSVYGVQTRTEIRGTAAWFGILLDMDPRHEADVRTIVDLELARVRNAAADTASFYADRDVLSRALRLEHASPVALRNWAMRRAWRPDLHHAFPDAGEYYATVGADSLAAFAARTFTIDRSITSITRPLPLHPLMLVLFAALACGAGIAAFRRLTFVTADMRRIRFIAHVRLPLAARVPVALVIAAAALAVVRLGAAGVELAAEQWLLPHDGFLHIVAAATLLLLVVTLGTLAAVGMLHSTVLVFEHEVRLKSPTFRSVIIPAARIRAAGPASQRRPARLRRPGPAFGSAVSLELDDGSGYLLHVRDPEGLISAISALTAASGTSTPPTPVVP